MDWRLTYLGSQIAVAVQQPAAYELLDKYALDTWSAGGCALLAEALHRLIDGSTVYALVSTRGVEHLVLRVDDAYIDSDGAYTKTGIVAKLMELEGVETRLRPFTGRLLSQVGDSHGDDRIFASEHAISETAELLSETVIPP